MGLGEAAGNETAAIDAAATADAAAPSSATGAAAPPRRLFSIF